MAKRLELDDFFGEVLPQRKIEIVRQFQEQGLTVAMVGDGVNDAPALALADVGIAVGTGTDVAASAAGILLVSADPIGVAKLVKLSKRSYRKMQQNLWWATGYNLLAIPAAAGAFLSLGIELSPAIGAVLMSVSTLVVAANAQLLRR
jgi:Cu2+-exporting ATPase